MKIGIVTTWFERGAAYVSRLYRDALAAGAGNRVFVYARGGEDYARGDPVWDRDYVTWGKKAGLPVATPVDLKDFRKWIINRKLDVVFFNEQHWWDPVFLCSDMGVKTGAYIDYYTEETIPLFANYDFLVCNTLRHKSAFENHPQAYYVPWGTDTGLFKPAKAGPVEPGVVTFFHSAGISPDRKGCDLVIRAFHALGRVKAKLVVHSQVSLKDYFPELRNMIEGLESSKRLVCHEKTVTAPGLYHLGDVYVYPSRLEGIGLTIAEALSCGLPVITSGSPPMSEFVDGKNGRTAEVERYYARSDGYYWPQCAVSVKSLAAQMAFYVKNARSIGRYKKYARQYALKRLDWKKNTRGLPEIFKSAPVLPADVKGAARVKAEAFERKRDNLKMKIYRWSPPAYRVIFSGWGLVKGLFGKKNHSRPRSAQ